jgi:chromosome segregation ATPase
VSATADSLRVLHLLAGHALTEAGPVLAQALRAHAQAEQVAGRCDGVLQRARAELARLARSPAINLAACDTVRRLLDAAQRRDADARQQLAQAERALDEARAELGRRRQREADLARARDRECEALRRAQQQRDDAALDDLWLQSRGLRA